MFLCFNRKCNQMNLVFSNGLSYHIGCTEVYKSVCMRVEREHLLHSVFRLNPKRCFGAGLKGMCGSEAVSRL